MSKTYHIAIGIGGDARLHNDPECQALKKAEAREIERSLYPNNEFCPYCTGENDPKPPEAPRDFQTGETICKECGGTAFQNYGGTLRCASCGASIDGDRLTEVLL